ncbi:MAG: YncE family protein, partial [Thermodesulfobacteriota bacterium]
MVTKNLLIINNNILFDLKSAPFLASILLLFIGLFGKIALPSQHPATLVIVNKSDNTVSLIDAISLVYLGEANTGHNPHEVATSPDGKLAYVTNYGTNVAPGNSISVIDIDKGLEVDKIDLGEY